MNKKRLLCIVLSLTAVFSMLFIKDSAAWIDTETGAPLGQQILVKKLNFEINGKLNSYLYYEDGGQYIISDQNLIFDNDGRITGVNYSTVDTEFRCRVVYDTPDQKGVVYSGSDEEHLCVEFDKTSDDMWIYNADDGYYYSEFDAVLGSETFRIINSIYYNGEKVTKEKYLPEVNGKTDPFKGEIKIEFQAKQKDFVEWTDIWTVTTTP